ncbi:hypothetical protein [Chryseobacterium sp. PET-29]|uniref:hypothetical protein n=1 Tax=Chryseobacterium sp. PET-29 TaxID=2983267 RepID=UPI0021E5D36E|nr:hypothetical protein [Chryseobacterium sp. PET-29]
MKIFINYEPPQKGAVLLKAFLSRAVALVLLLTVSFIYAQNPGGVSSNLALWLSADSGGASWTDRSPLNTTVTRTGTVVSTNNQVNFNPGLVFSGITSYYDTGLNIARGTYANVSVFAVANGRGENGRMMFSSSSANNHRGLTSNAFACGNVPSYTAKNGYGVYRATYVTNTSNTSTLSYNGVQQLATTDNNGTAINMKIGGGYYSSSSSDIAEILAYRGTLTPTQVNQIESYLALKYGASLGSNYILSDGSTTVWNTVTNAGYNNNIAGIGRDDDSGLSQKQSQSVNSGLQPVIGNVTIAATNQSNSNSLNTDMSSMVWGSDTGSTNFTTAFAFGGLNNRMARIWRVQETGTVGTVKVALKVSDLPSSVTNPTLLVSSDAVFDGTDTRQTMILETIGGVQYYTTTVDLTSGQFFSFAGFVTAPGGVLGGSAWLKADSGDNILTGNNVNVWKNQFDGLNNFSGVSNPQYSQVGMNFNPVMQFSGSNYFESNSSIPVSNNTNYSKFAVFMSTSTTAAANILSSATGGNSAFYITAGTLSIYHNGNIGNSVAVSANIPTIGTGVWSNGTTNGSYVKANGKTGTAFTSSTSYTTGKLQVGAFTETANIPNLSKIPEALIYQSALSIAEVNRIESYLAIKYGITLDQSTVQNYLASDATVLWNATINSTYNNNIAGIGRDDASALSQKQSQSVNSGIQPVIGNGNIFNTNANNTNSFSADKSFLVWGSDTGSTNFATAFAFGGLNNRMARIWKVQETGTVGTVKVALAVSDVPGSVTNPTLLLSTDAVFDGTDIRQTMVLETIGGIQYYTTTVDFTSGQFFSFAGFVAAPGGVLGTALWLKADSGTSSTVDNTAISQWNDQANANNAVQSTTASQPVYRDSGASVLNFNPTVVFDGTNDYLTVPYSPSYNGDITVFSMHNLNNISSYRSPIGSRSTTSATRGWNWYYNAGVREFWTGDSSPTVWNTLFSTTYTVNTPELLTFDATLNSTNSNKNIYVSNRLLSVVTNGKYVSNTTNSLCVGCNSDPSFYWSGPISEQVLYSRVLTNLERLRVNSYLAIKYGITLDQGTTFNFNNGDFSDNFNFWTTSGNVGVFSGAPYFNGSDATPNGVISQQINTVNGQSYNFTGNVFRGGGGSGTVRLRLDIVDNVTNSVIATQNLTPASTLPTAFTQSFTGNGNSFTIKFTDVSLATVNVDIGIDNLQLSPNASTIGQNYLNSSGSVIWDATANNVYNNNIAGIGRDDASALSQKQSQSVNSGIQPVIGNGNISDTNANNPNSFTADNSFMVWGSDAGSTSFATSFAFGSSNFRMTRVWKVQETGTVGTVKVALPVSELSVSIAQPVLLRSTDAVFDGTDTSLPMNLETIGGVQYYTATIDFASGQYFTFAAFVTAPGGVISGLNLWLKANAGFSSSQWLDQSGSGFIYQQNTAANQPAATGIMNFNTAIRFDGTNDSMSLTSVTGLMNGSIDSNYTQIAALNSNSATATGISDIDSSCGANGDLIWQSDGTIYIDRAPCGTGQPNFGGSTIVPNVSYLNTLTYASPSGQIFTYRNNLQNGTGIQTGVVTTINSAMLGFGSIGSYYNGNIGEYIVYNNTISALERLKIDSYLAIKYGVTLDQSTKLNFNNGDFSNNFNFWSSTGNVGIFSGAPSFNGSDTTPNGVISQQINTVNGQSYNFTGDVFRGGGGSGTVRLRLDIIDNVTNSVIATQNLTPASTIPTAFSQSFTGNGNSFTIKFTDISLATTNVDIGVDNLQLSPNASTTGTNYVNSQGSIVWNAAANASYNKNIAGIGRDDASALVQKQSQSANTGNQLIMGLASVAATNTANTGSFAADKQFLVWGDDDQSGSSAFTGIPGYNSRLNRVWKVQNTNNLNQNVQVLVPLALVPATSSLLAGTDATFAGSYQVYNPTGTVTVNSVSYRAFTLPAVMVNQPSFYMTFAFYEQSPGGVRSEALWLRGDAGLAGVTSWLDQSGNNRNLRWDITNCQGHTSSGQMVLGKTLNFNSVASFGDVGYTWGFTQTDISRTTTPNADVAIVYKANLPSVQDVWSTDWGGALDERALTTTQIANDNTAIAYGGGNSGYATINVASFKNTASNGSNLLINGNNVLNFTGQTRYVGCPQITLGDVWGAQDVFRGLIGEFVVYRSNITAIERIQLNSYLSLKYGITLGRNNNGNATSGEVVSGAVLEGDYLASDGITRTWNSDAVYQNNIVGLGRDDISAFHQRITTSQSASPDIITLSTDANFTNNNQSGGSGHTDIANDKSFFITGNNNAATSYTLKSGLINGMNALMKRVWKTQNTGTSFDVYIKSSNAKASYLVYSADATFSSGVTYVPLTAGATPGIQIPNGNYFTFAAFLEAPGGVFDESLWLKADAGTSSTTNGTGLSQWDDQSGVGNNATQSNAGNRPVYNNSASTLMNYNPVVNFNNGSANYFRLNRALLPSGNSSRSVIATYASPGSASVISWGNASTNLFYNVEIRPLRLDYGGGNRAGSGGSTNANPTINSSIYNGSANSMYELGRAISSSNLGLNTASGLAGVGVNVWDGGYNYSFFKGRMPELIVYPKALNGTQRSQVDSYLAIKYGLTLDQTTPQNYLASDGVTVVWTAASGYNNNIIGLAKDRTATLHQRISTSQMPVKDIITLSTDNNFTNPNQSGAGGHTDIVNDRYFFMTGNNGQAAVFTQKTGLANNLRVVMGRVWRVQQTGTAQNIYINVNNSRATYLIYSTDPSFSSGITYVPLTSGTTSALQIPTGNYFTFAAPATGPGGVTDNLVRWYRADRDVTTGSTLRWADQMQNSDAVQSVAGNQPTYNTTGSALLNFNSSFTFNSANANYLSFSDTGMASGSTSRSVFGVGRTSVTGGTFEWISSYGTSGSGQNFGLMRSGNNVLVTTFGSDLLASTSNPYASNTPVLSYGAASGGTLFGTFNARPLTSIGGSVSTSLNVGRIGTRQSLGEYWNGIISEVVYYNKIPTTNEKQRVDSYMGLKYGVSLGTSSNLFTYLASDSTPFWTGDATYQNNIAAIGRDDFSDLQQKQSQSVNSGNQVILGLDTITGSNDTNTGSFDNDLQFLAWGDNNTAGTIPFTAVYPNRNRLSRVWKAQNTGSFGKDVQVLIPASLIGNLDVPSLLYSTSATFASGNLTYASTGTVNVNSVNYYSFTLPASQVNTPVFYFTIAYYTKAPGGVEGENLWLRADDGVSATTDNTPVSQWNDQSGNGSHGTQATGSKQPVYRNDISVNMNFNPVMNFSSASSQNFDITGDLAIGGQQSVATFAVADASAGARYFLEPKATGNNLLQFRSTTQGNSTLTLSNGTSVTNTLAGTGASVLYSGWRATGTLFAGVNGNAGTSVASATNWVNGPLSLGAAYNQTAFTNGKIPEVVEYSKSLTAIERQRVNSYLSLKYGITMDQSTIQDYLASDGTISWAKDAVYKFNIAGIGRDDITALNQKQSQSVNTGSQVAVSLGEAAATNSANVNTFNTDMQYLIWGDDNGSLSTTTTTGNVLASNGNTYTKRMTRVWRMQNKGSFAQDVTVYFPASAFPSASAAGLIYATTAAKLSDGTATVIPAIGTATVNGTDYYAFPVSAASLAGLSYMSFTTATAVCYKPAVTAGTALNTKAGITSLARAGSAGDNWPMVRNGGWLALEAKTKGMVINRVRFNASNQPVADDGTTLILTSPIEGMMVMDVTNRIFKIYTSKDGGATYGWYAFGEQSCPD